MDLGVLLTSTAPMDRNTENPRFFKDSEGKKKNFKFPLFSWIGLDVLVSNSANRMWYLH